MTGKEGKCPLCLVSIDGTYRRERLVLRGFSRFRF